MSSIMPSIRERRAQIYDTTCESYTVNGDTVYNGANPPLNSGATQPFRVCVF